MLRPVRLGGLSSFSAADAAAISAFVRRPRLLGGAGVWREIF